MCLRWCAQQNTEPPRRIFPRRSAGSAVALCATSPPGHRCRRRALDAARCPLGPAGSTGGRSSHRKEHSPRPMPGHKGAYAPPQGASCHAAARQLRAQGNRPGGATTADRRSRHAPPCSGWPQSRAEPSWQAPRRWLPPTDSAPSPPFLRRRVAFRSTPGLLKLDRSTHQLTPRPHGQIITKCRPEAGP